MKQFHKKIINRDMFYNYNSVAVYYKVFHEGRGDPIFLLHGWGVNGKIFDQLIENFPEKTFVVVDFPPFGESDKNIKDWTIFTYASLFMSLCDHLKIEKCDILGHSFGGRVAIIVSAIRRSLVHSCILVDSAGLRPRRKMKYYVNLWKYKIYKKLGKDVSRFGSSDYKPLPPEMKDVFKNIVSTYLEEYARRSKVKTLLVWGENDKETPLYMGKRLNRYIKTSRLYVMKNTGHFPFLDKPLEFYQLINNFWEDPWYI